MTQGSNYSDIDILDYERGKAALNGKIQDFLLLLLVEVYGRVQDSTAPNEFDTRPASRYSKFEKKLVPFTHTFTDTNRCCLTQLTKDWNFRTSVGPLRGGKD
jgi:hypothetical protein